MQFANTDFSLGLLTEMFEFSTADTFISAGVQDTVACFDLFFRRIPDKGGFAIAAGLSQVIDALKNLRFTEADLTYLKTQGCSEALLSYLREFQFHCDVWAIPEGTPVFPNEPIVKVRGPIIEAQMIETLLLLIINQQSLIATKANRLVRAAHGTAVVEFGARRAPGFDESVYGSRAAYIGGCAATSGITPAKEFGIPLAKTMLHSWVQLFDDEYEAFCSYAKANPDDCSLVVDTYDTLKSGIPNAIRAFDDVLLPLGKRPKSIRIDSGDITYLSMKARKMLDAAGYADCNIMASNGMDENIITEMVSQGAKVDGFIAGERLITSASSPVFDGVYKLCAIAKEGRLIPKINLSENVHKITIPSSKQVYRLFDMESGKAIADLLATDSEEIDETKPYELFDPDYTWKRKEIENFVARPLLQPIFKKGELCYKEPALSAIRDYCAEQVDTLWDEVKRFENPHKYYVDLSPKLWDLRNLLIEDYKGVRK